MAGFVLLFDRLFAFFSTGFSAGFSSDFGGGVAAVCSSALGSGGKAAVCSTGFCAVGCGGSGIARRFFPAASGAPAGLLTCGCCGPGGVSVGLMSGATGSVSSSIMITGAFAT